jgi:hypothetical protein
MAINNDDNKKLPETPGAVTGNKDSRYFTIHHGVDGTGSQHYAPFDLSESKQYSFDESWNSTGGYKTREAHKKTEMSTSCEYEVRGYCIGGSSVTGETHGQSFYNDTFSRTVVGGDGEDIGGSKYSGVAGPVIKSIGGGEMVRRTTGSLTPKVDSTSGDKNTDVEGSNYTSVGQSAVRVVKKDDVVIVNEGDHAMHVQKGSYDVQVTSGKLHLMTSGDELIANSNVKVLLQVGSLSKITMDPSKIKLQVGGGSYIEITESNIKLVSPRIDLNP